MNELILTDIIASFVISIIVFCVLKIAKKMETNRALKITFVVFVATATVIGIILVWMVSRQPVFEPVNVALYSVRPMVNTSCLQQCEQIADKAGEAFQNCIRSCRRY